MILSQIAVFVFDFTDLQGLLLFCLISAFSAVNFYLSYFTDFSRRFSFPKKTWRSGDKTLEFTNIRVAGMGLLLVIFGIYCLMVVKAYPVGLVIMASGINYISYSRIRRQQLAK